MMCKMFECVKFTRTECGQQSHQNLNYFINCNITFGHWAAAAKLNRTTEKKTITYAFCTHAMVARACDVCSAVIGIQM